MTEPTYPHADGDVTVLGPEIFASPDGDVISWKGDNYVRQAAVSAGEGPATDQAEAVASCPGYETSPNLCRCPCYGCKHHCSAHNPDDTDLTEADVDRLMTEGVPVEIVTAPPATRGAVAAAERSDVGTEFVRQADHPNEAGLTAFEADLASKTGTKADSKAATEQAANESTAGPDVATRAGQNLTFSAQPATDQAAPVCRFDEGCHRVVACDPGCGAPLAATDQAALRKPAYDAVFAYLRKQPVDFLPVTIVGRNAMIWHAVHAALNAVLPAPADRATVLPEPTDDDVERLGQWLWDNCSEDERTGLLSDDPRRIAAVVLRWPELRRVAAESAPATAPQPVAHAPGKAIRCPDCRNKGHAVCMPDEQAAAAQQPETPALFCVCGAPAHRDGDRWTHQPGTGDHCLYRPNARPRCPDCRLPHDLTPGGMAMRACASILASIADRDAAAQQPKEA